MASNASFESVGFDFEASDAIFATAEPIDATNGDIDNEDGDENDDDNNDCDCSTCRERMRHKEELNRLKQTWVELRRLGCVNPPLGSVMKSTLALNVTKLEIASEIRPTLEAVNWM